MTKLANSVTAKLITPFPASGSIKEINDWRHENRDYLNKLSDENFLKVWYMMLKFSKWFSLALTIFCLLSMIFLNKTAFGFLAIIPFICFISIVYEMISCKKKLPK